MCECVNIENPESVGDPWLVGWMDGWMDGWGMVSGCDDGAISYRNFFVSVYMMYVVTIYY